MNARERNVPIGGHIIREKALDFAKELNITDFQSSEGWLDRWKNRHNVGSFKPNSSNPSQVKNFKIFKIFTI